MTNEQMFQLVFNDHGISTLGWMFAAAMAIGFLLDEDGRKIRTWLFVICMYFVVQEIVRYDLFQRVSHSAPLAVETVNVVIWLTYSAGLCLGWVLSYFSKKKGRQDYKLAKQRNGEYNGEDKRNALDKAQEDEKAV